MSLYNEIDQLKSSVNQTATETLPPGYIAGFDLSVIDARIYCGPGICNYNGKKMTFPTGRYLLDSEWVSKNKLPETVYYVYLTTGAAFFVDLNAPDFSALQFGDYHPTLGYRYIGKAKTNAHGVIDIVANSRNIIAENIDFEAIEGSRIQAQTIESKQLIIGDQEDPVGDPIPTDVELWRYNDLSCASTLGTRPVSKNVKLEQGDIGSVENPWYYERRWTVPKGLVAAYTMNAGVGTVLRDDSGNFRDATITGPTWNSGGKQGYCLSFDGSNDYVTLPSTPSTSTTRTISVWAKTGAADSTTKYIMDAQTNRFILAWNTNTSGKIGFYDGTWRSFGDAPNDDEWHHIVLLCNGTTSKADMYIDGEAFGSQLDYTPVSITSAPVIGAYFGLNASFYEGELDNFLYYDRILTEAEISALYAETSPYTDVNAAPCDNAIWCGKTTTNLVRTTDLDDDTKWTHNATWNDSQSNVYDPDLLKTVFKWTKGTTTNQSRLFDETAATGLAAGTYTASLMVKCNYDIVVLFQIYGLTPGSVFASSMLIPANTWTLYTGRVTTAAATFTHFIFQFWLPGSGNFAADIEFRACDPYVALESYPMPFAPTTRPAASLWYNYTWPQQGTVGFWCKPGFNFNKTNDTFFVTDYNGALVDIRIYYDAANDKWTAQMAGSTTVTIQGTAITSNAALQKWWMIAVTYDVTGDSLKLYCYNVDYPTGDNASSAADLGTVAFNSYLNVGGIPKYTSPATFEADSLIAGLFIDDTVWTEEELKAHYDSGRVYYDPNVIMNYSRGVAIDKNGILIKDGSLNIIDNYGREIDISNQSGMLAKDASGVIIHDIPTAPNIINSYYMGHLYLHNLVSDALVNGSNAKNTWTAQTISTYGATNIKGVRIRMRCAVSDSSPGTSLNVSIAARPYGTTSVFTSAIPTGYVSVSTANNELANLQHDVVLDVPVVANQFEWWIDSNNATSQSTTIHQLGYWA